MISIVVLGTGNVATHLLHAFKNAKGVEVRQVYGRNTANLKGFGHHTLVVNTIQEIVDADVYVLAISDGSIAEVSKALGKKEGLVVHTSGSVPLKAIHTKQRGVFYPLQTFTKGKNIDFSAIPICIEAETESDYCLLEQLGTSISNSVQRVTSEQRKKLHLSAVLVNNFPNHLYSIAYDICTENDIPFQLLWPLISETVDKIRHLSPKEAQTGPAKRNDVITIQEHLEQLKNPLHKKIYQLLSESIRESKQ